MPVGSRKRSSSPSDDSPPPSAKKIDIRHDTIVEVLVGPDKEIFHVHRRLLSTFSDVLAAGFRTGSFREGLTCVMEMPEHDPAIFQHVCEWLYNGTFSIACLTAAEAAADNEGECPANFNHLFRLYVFADKFMIPVLKFEVLRSCYKHMRRHSQPELPEIFYLYANTVPKAALRTLVADSLIKDGALKDLMEKRRDECLACPDFVEDVIGRFCDKQVDSKYHAMGSTGEENYLRRLEKMEKPEAPDGEGG